tara:strand:+ start:1554 stop:1787 length:234 start_codon:yes stop_codon:yes gene_type:complete
MKKLLHNPLFWRIIWAYTIIIYSYFFGMLIITGEDPKIISEVFTSYLYIGSGILIVPLMTWGAYNQFRIAREQRKTK